MLHRRATAMGRHTTGNKSVNKCRNMVVLPWRRRVQEASRPRARGFREGESQPGRTQWGWRTFQAERRSGRRPLGTCVPLCPLTVPQGLTGRPPVSGPLPHTGLQQYGIASIAQRFTYLYCLQIDISAYILFSTLHFPLYVYGVFIGMPRL